jgi:phenylalanyl-tRNA synthetase beta chain
LRPYIVPNLAGAAAYNLKRGAPRAKLFEIGHVFGRQGEEVRESERLAVVAAGARFPLDWTRTSPEEYDFWDLKGDVEDLLATAVGIAPGFAPGERPWLHPGRQAEIERSGGVRIGFCGEVHPQVAAAWGIERRMLVAEIDLEPLLDPAGELRVETWSREPMVERDIALVVPEAHAAEDVLAAVRGVGLEHLARVRVFDRYAGPQLAAGHYSLGLRLTFGAERTLTDEEVDGEMKRLLEALRAERGYGIR